jgi:predicted permease
MSTLREWLERLTAMFGRGRRDQDLEEELRLHLELVADEARRRGADPDEARRLARIEAGGASQAMDSMRDQRGLPWLDDLTRDLGYGVRALRRRPGFTIAAALSLALGIGANTGIFSLLDQLLLRALPVHEPERLVMLGWSGPSLANVQRGDETVFSYPLCRELEEQRRVFESAACSSPADVNLSTGQAYEVVHAELVTGSYFQVLGVRAARGRVIAPSDDVTPAQHPVVVISHDYWTTRLASAPDVIGRRMLVNNHPMSVIGVAAPGFRGLDIGDPASVWIPTMMAREATLEFNRILDRRALWLYPLARLRAGLTGDEAERSLQPWFASMLSADSRREDFPRVSDEQRQRFLSSTIAVSPGSQGFTNLRRSFSRPFWALLSATLLLLLLASLNVASLLLARGAERSLELTTRMALGASRGRITRQLVVETLVLAMAGGALGLIAAPAVSRLMLRFLPDGVNLAPELDGRVFLFALAVTLAAGLLCSLAPALQASRRPLATSMTGRATAAVATVRLRKVIVGAQIALTVVLLAGAGLFVQTLNRLYARDRGYDSTPLLMFRADPAGTGSAPADAPPVMRDLLAALQEVPGVERAAISNIGLFGAAGPGRVLTIDAAERVALDAPVPMARISPAYFATIGVKVLAGREFDRRDVEGLDKTGFRTIIVNERFAKRYFGDLDPVGRHVGIGNQPGTDTNIEIIGVVDDFSRRAIREDAQPEHIFFPFTETGPLAGDGNFLVRVRGEPEAVLPAIRTAVARVDPQLPLIALTTVDEQITRSLRRERMLATLSTGFGSVALLLSAIGLFGVMSYAVTQRTQEIGMRMALGATRSGTISLIIRDALVVIAAGSAAGIGLTLLAAAAAAPWLADVLYGIKSTDASTFTGATTGLVAVAVTACAIPAARAALLPPMAAIRDQPESMWRLAGARVRQAIHDVSEAGARRAGPSVTLISDLTAMVHGAASFTEALRIALPALRERLGARTLVLLERTSSEQYAGETLTIPANGILLNRLTHFPHPLPIPDGDLQAWLRWARQLRPEHVPEIESLEAAGVRMAAGLRTRHEIVGVLLLGPPEHGEAFTKDDRQLLSTAAEVFALMIENARLNDRALEQERVRRDLALAAEVQRRLLPTEQPSVAGLSLAAFTLPARTVGGDYYDFIDLPDGRIGLALADIAGKGIAAALLMSVVQASLRVIAEGEVTCAELAAKMNRFLYRSTSTSSYATFFYAQIDPGRGRLRYVNAGHNPPYLVRRTGAGVDIIELSEGGTVLGLFPDMPYQDADVEVRPGDLLVAFTDGVSEARSAADEEFGEERLKALLRDVAGAPAAEVSAVLADRMRAWSTGAEQHDDLTFVVATINQPAGSEDATAQLP